MRLPCSSPALGIRERKYHRCGGCATSNHGQDACVPRVTAPRARRSSDVGGLEYALRLGHAVTLRVVDAEALQHVDDFLILGKLGDGLLAGQVSDLVDG